MKKDIDLKNQPETFDWRWLIFVGVILIGLFCWIIYFKRKKEKEMKKQLHWYRSSWKSIIMYTKCF